MGFYHSISHCNKGTSHFIKSKLKSKLLNYFFQIEPKFSSSFEYESFVTVRTGRGGYGDWIRYWAVLSKDRITFWKYPEDKEDLPAEGHISLKYVVSPMIKTANKIMTKRPNTIELYHADPKPGKG